MRFSAPSRVDAVDPWYRLGAKATNPAGAARSPRPLKKSCRPPHAGRTRRPGPLPVFGPARYPETFPSWLLSSTIVIFHIAVTGEWPIRHLNLRLNGHGRSTPRVKTQRGRIGFEHPTCPFHDPSFVTIFREMPPTSGPQGRRARIHERA